MMSANVSAAKIEITDSKATPEYWINRNPNGNNVILTPEQIKKFNSFILGRDSYMADLANYPSELSAAEVNALIKKGEYKTYTGSHNVSESISVRYAVTVERGDIRLQPKDWIGDNYDNLQGTAIDPAEAVAVLLDSPDGKFVFVQSRNYMGWLNKSKIAFTDRDTWLKYVQPQDFIVITSNKKNIEVQGKNILFQMGAVIPIVDPDKYDDIWVMSIPTSVNGNLQEVNVNIAMYDNDINKGFLSCSEDNFIRQSFKFLGDEYGWGGLNDSVDCSAFVGDIYRSMGMNIPRDTDRQEGAMPIFAVFNNVTNSERWDIVSRAPVGALLFKPGHVMMKIGNDDSGRPLVIHSASSYYDNGSKIYVRKVLVSDLHYKNASGIETIDSLSGIAFCTNSDF